MEPLYAKLYDKYAGLKVLQVINLALAFVGSVGFMLAVKKVAGNFGLIFGYFVVLGSGEDAAQKDQEAKFTTCIAAAKELIWHLRKENDALHDRIEELVGHGEPSVDYKKLLMEEIEKNRRFSEEVNKLQSRDCRGSDGGIGKASTPVGAQGGTGLNHGTTGRSSKKRRMSSGSDVDGKGSKKPLYEEAVSLKAHEDAQKSDCQVRTGDISGELMNGHSTSECLFRIIIQCAHGLNFLVSQAGDICVALLHELSGYSFALTWSRNDGEVELMYNVLSMGTLERIAAEWMKEVIEFRVSMCPVFFQRIANVTKNRGSGTFR